MNFWEGIGSTVGGIAAACTGGFTIYKLFVKKWIDKFRARRKAELKSEQEALWLKLKEALIVELEKQNVNIKQIRDKIFPNGGTSLDDKLEVSLKDNQEIKLALIKLMAGQRNTWELMDVAVWISDDQGKTIYVNKPYCELVGCTYPDALGMSWLGLIHKGDRGNVRDAWKESVENISDFDMCYWVHRSDGAYQKVNAIAIHNRETDGKLRSSMGRLIAIGEPTRDMQLVSGK